VDTKRLDLNLLVTLEALLAEQNVTRAAARLHLSQPAVSAQLSRLRDMFDDPLLIPAQRGMTPTAKALELVEPLREALDQLRAAVSTQRAFDPAKARLTVAIAASDYLQAALLQALVLDLRHKAPGVRVALRNLDATQLEAQMVRGEVDLALMTPQTAPSGLRSRRLFDERFVVIARRNHPRVRRKLTVAQFAALEHVVVSPRGGGFTTQADTALAALDHKRTVALSAASFLFVPELVAASDFVALVPERLVRDRADRLQVLECPFEVKGFAVAMLWHERNHGHPGQRWVRERVVALAGGGQSPEAA
jgi:DNA-binding transcriptional LysR family regulator